MTVRRTMTINGRPRPGGSANAAGPMRYNPPAAAEARSARIGATNPLIVEPGGLALRRALLRSLVGDASSVPEAARFTHLRYNVVGVDGGPRHGAEA
jgi:hypothetical protein